MRRVLLILATITLMLPPTVLMAQSPSPEVKKTAKADEAARPSGDGAGQAMKDSWITTKTKLALTTDNRTKARHISVETRAAVVMLRGKTGESASQTLVMRNSTSRLMSFDVVAQDVVVSGGRRRMIPAGAIAGSIAATAVFSTRHITVPAGGSTAVTMTVTVPPNAAPRAGFPPLCAV